MQQKTIINRLKFMEPLKYKPTPNANSKAKNTIKIAQRKSRG